MTKAISSRVSALALALIAAPVLAMSLLASKAHAAIEYTSQLATTTDFFQAVGYDLTQSAVVVIGIVMGIAVFIFVVFWGWRKLKRSMKG